MALAEGTLGEAAATAARAEIAGCAECSRDLELQRLALSQLNELPAVYLTATESAWLHDTLKRELDLAPVAAAPRRARPAWGRWIPIAAAAAVLLVVVVSVPNLLGGGDDASTEVLSAADTTTTAAAAEEAAPAPRVAGEDTAQPESVMQSGAAPTTAASAETTTTAATETTEAMAMGDNAYDGLRFLGAVSGLDRVELLADLLGEGDELRSVSEETRASYPEVDACLEALADPDTANPDIPANGEPLLMGTVVDDTGEELFLVAFVTEELDQTVFVTLRPLDCHLVVVADQ